MSDQHDDRGKVALWRSKSQHPKAPKFWGKVTAHRDIKEGEEVDISLWECRSNHPRAPELDGKIRDREYPSREPEPSDMPADDDLNDDIPF